MGKSYSAAFFHGHHTTTLQLRLQYESKQFLLQFYTLLVMVNVGHMNRMINRKKKVTLLMRPAEMRRTTQRDKDCTWQVSWRFKCIMLTVLAVCKDGGTIHCFFFLFSDKSIWSLETVIPKAWEVTKWFPSPLRKWQPLGFLWTCPLLGLFFHNLSYVLTGTKHSSKPQLFRGCIHICTSFHWHLRSVCERHVLCQGPNKLVTEWKSAETTNKFIFFLTVKCSAQYTSLLLCEINMTIYLILKQQRG